MNIDFVQELHDLGLKQFSAVKFDKRSDQHRHIISLYASMTEQTGSLIAIVRSGSDAGTGSVFRTFLEAYVDLKNLVGDDKYINHLMAKYHSEWIRLLEAAEKGNNPFLADVAKIRNFQNILADRKKHLANLKANGYHPLTIADQFIKAGMEDVYRSVYNFQCSESHNDLRALIGRHLESSGDDFSLVMYRKPSDEELIPMWDSVAGILWDSGIEVHTYFKSGLVNSFDGLRKTLDELRKKHIG
ncbi:MAG: hypothetical protein EOR01_05375 [Mesorhizobium sp.]|uniref:DUF5677 domain-containing protein n=1 Tax=Mesorhizobium sp. TaxID=1871066 RepID=UPI000FE9C3C9|nr:DUF5677 domain-containing protein [Mesorhizobium sp.]RWP24957.1 MAG: hypothetical protein EOR01_05375 [Mesorhizobium sp.]